MTKVGHARQTIMQAKLAAASDSVTGQSTVNKDGYLTDLDSQRVFLFDLFIFFSHYKLTFRNQLLQKWEI